MKVFIRCCVIYVFLLVLFTLLMIGSNLIPSSAIAPNVLQSAKVLDREGVAPRILNFNLYALDNNTDALMLDLSLAVDCSKPVESSMMNYYYHSADSATVFSSYHFLKKRALILCQSIV